MGDSDVGKPSTRSDLPERVAEPTASSPPQPPAPLTSPPPLLAVSQTISSYGRHRRWVALAVAVSALLGGGSIAVQERPRTAVSTGTAPSAAHAPTVDSASPPRGVRPSADRQRLAVAQALLDRRATAIERRDQAGFNATIDPDALEFRSAQADMFDSLSAVPYDRWAYTIERLDPFELPEARRRELGPTAFTARVSSHYRIEGYDHADAFFETYLTFVRRGRSWYVTSDADGAELGHRTQRQLWDFGEVTVVRGERSIVLGLGKRSTLERHAADADAAVPRVTRVWGADWVRKVVIIAPDTQEHMAAVLGADEDRYNQIAAITRAESSSPAGPAVADRIVINPAIWPQLDPYGRRIVMTHEVTHVATGMSSGGGVPMWLSEGFADYIGYLGTGIAPHVAAPELFRAVREDGPPGALPADEDFQPDNEALAQAYQEAWLACRLIVEEYGEDELVALYRAAGSAQLDKAFGYVLGTTTSQFTKAWVSYVDELAT